MARYVVGIDLGTTNCAVAYVDTEGSGAIEHFSVVQAIAPGEVAERATLPSFLLLPTEHEVAPAAMALPWSPAPEFTVGEFARERGAELPHRLVSSAKSWLSYTGVDRTAPILPWRGADAEPELKKDTEVTGPQVSPVEASARYLGHLRDAWDTAFPGAPLGQQDIFLTVPASFDAVARELTVTAARQAGFQHITLLEEPQAAFYSWLARAEAENRDWRQSVNPGDVVLVCDIGGGTTDFSLIAIIDDGAGNLALERVAVGDHILLGGDNMDLALAHLAMHKLGDKAKKLKPMQQRSLVHAARRAKETLLAAGGGPGGSPGGSSGGSPGGSVESVPITILGSGSKLIGGTLRTELTRGDIETLMRDGFFPAAAADARPQARRAVGLRELGLPYAHDPAVTRHLATFLGRHGRQPTALLYNGGVMKARLLRERVAEITGTWFGDAPLPVLEASERYLDLAVAHGAAYYGLVRRGKGIRIRGGTARAYYIGVESSMPAIPGFAPPVMGLCVAPFGMEEGSSVDLPGEELGLVVGETAVFRFFASSARKDDGPGAIVDPDEDGVVELAPVEAVLPADESIQAGDLVPVTLSSHVTEVGTLELYCVAHDQNRRWKLEYSVRETEG